MTTFTAEYTASQVERLVGAIIDVHDLARANGVHLERPRLVVPRAVFDALDKRVPDSETAVEYDEHRRRYHRRSIDIVDIVTYERQAEGVAS